jgi:hypothetical protein
MYSFTLSSLQKLKKLETLLKIIHCNELLQGKGTKGMVL